MESDSVRPVPFDSHSIAAAMLRARKSPAVREFIATARRAQRKQAARDAANAVALADAQAQAELDCETYGHVGWRVCARCSVVLVTEQRDLLLQVAELGRSVRGRR